MDRNSLAQENEELRGLLLTQNHILERNKQLEEEIEAVKLDKEKEIERLNILNEGLERELERVPEPAAARAPEPAGTVELAMGRNRARCCCHPMHPNRSRARNSAFGSLSTSEAG